MEADEEIQPENYVGACLDFLQIPGGASDLGFGLPLRRLATDSGHTPMQQLNWLLTEQIQSALLLVLRASAASSLPIERAFAEVKRSDAPRLCHVATAGRNQVLRQHLRQREELLREATRAAANMRRSTMLRLTSLARELRPELWDDEGSQTKQFVKCNTAWLQQELERRRREAKLAVERASSGDAPVTQAEWTQWLADHETEFRELMDSAAASRRKANHRLSADPDAPKAVARIRPAEEAKKKEDGEKWWRVLRGKNGWVCLAHRGKSQRLLWLYTVGGVTYCLDLTMAKQDREYVLDENAVQLLRATLTRLDSLVVEQVDQALVCSVSALAEPGRVRLQIQAARLVEEPLQVRRRGPVKRSAPGADAVDAEEEDEEEELAMKASKEEDWSGSSSAGSVDTDRGSDLDECLRAVATKAEAGDVGVSELSEPERAG